MKKVIQRFLAAALVLVVLAPAVNAQKWSSDGVHSTLMYSIRHYVTPMVGLFRKFNVDVSFDAKNPTATTIEATVDVNSVQMGMDKLEGHLKSPDFFDAAKYPEWSFKSTSVKAAGKKTPNKYIATGDLTVHGVTKTISIPFEFLGAKENPHGTKAGFSTEFTINRFDYGIGKDDGAGNVSAGPEVKITVLLEMNPSK